MANETVKKISELAKGALRGTDFFLVDVEIKGGDQPVVWIYVDGENEGVNMDECADLSKELGFLLDAHEMFGGGYRLNVSSPGLSRPLSDRRQYPKHQGRKSKIKYRNRDSYETVKGTLSEVSENTIHLEREDGEVLRIDFDQVVETKIIPSL